MATQTTYPHGKAPDAVQTDPAAVMVGDMITLWGRGTPKVVESITVDNSPSWDGTPTVQYSFKVAGARETIVTYAYEGKDSAIYVHPAGGHSIPVVTFQFNGDPATYSFEIATDSRDPKFLASCALDYVARVAWHDFGIEDVSIPEPTPMFGSRIHYASIESGRDNRVDWRSVGWVSFLLPNVGE